MEDKINEIKEYFNTKLIMGDYEITRLGHHSMHILIDGKYNFQVFIGQIPLNFGFSYDYKGDWYQIKMIKDNMLKQTAFVMAIHKRGLIEKQIESERIAQLEEELNNLKNK